jgi:ABC-type antimicrobial peptide transport system permease subunit
MVGTYAFIRSRDAVPTTVRQALAALREVDPNFSPMVVFQGSYKQWIENVYWTHLLSSRLMMVFAALAFLLAVLGIHGLVAYLVSQQLRETGIRLALGATPGRIVSGFVAGSAKLALTGLAGGLVVVAVLAPRLASLVPKAAPRDPGVYCIASAVVGVTVLLATWLPARRAAKVDPVIALRAE